MEWFEYFESYREYFWQWEEEATVLAVPNGSTIAYTSFVTELMEHLAEQGLPHFGSLLLAIIATNPDGERAISNVYAQLSISLGDLNPDREPLTSAVSFLKMVSQLPQQYRTGRNRFLLFQTLFFNCHNIISVTTSKTILEAFRQEPEKPEKLMQPRAFSSSVYHHDFRVISLLAKKFPDIKSIVSKLADLPPVDKPLELEPALAEPHTQKDFVDRLIEHPQTFPAGSLIRGLWSSLQIPYHHAMPSQQAMGGISDLTNKGSFDRLLLSEFAHDDLLFLTRLANNEALYVNRETPPHRDQPERIILIDVSIRNWGIPRVIAYALLLAIAKHPKTDIGCKAFAVGNSVYPFSFDTIGEIIESMQILEPSLHAAAGLAAFFREHKPARNQEIFFISSSESFDQAPLQKAVSDHYSFFRYFIHTDNTGNVALFKTRQNSTRQVQQFRIDLEKQWKRENKKQPEPAEPVPEQGETYPLLFPDTPNPKKILMASDGKFFLITAEKALLKSAAVDATDERKGWELIYENLPYSSQHAEIGTNAKGEYLLLMFYESSRKLYIFNLNTNEQASAIFSEWRKSEYQNFIFHEDRFIYSYLGYPSKYWTIALEQDKIRISSLENIPKWITDEHVFREKELAKLKYRGCDSSLLKNITDIFVNDMGNLVFNRHELRLDVAAITLHELEPRLVRKKISAKASRKNRFYFPDGSTITINKSGMLILGSSNPSIGKIYVPSVIDMPLGVATEHLAAGSQYFFRPEEAQREQTVLQTFCVKFLKPFINTIVQYGAED